MNIGELSREQLEKQLVLTRQALARAWSAWLDVVLNERLDDGTPLLEYVLISNPELAKRLRGALSEPPEVSAQIGAPTTTPERDRRPHSRACGWREHPHGAQCSRNCPSCGGRELRLG